MQKINHFPLQVINTVSTQNKSYFCLITHTRIKIVHYLSTTFISIGTLG